jgi:serine/threonine protein kinase
LTMNEITFKGTDSVYTVCQCLCTTLQGAIYEVQRKASRQNQVNGLPGSQKRPRSSIFKVLDKSLIKKGKTKNGLEVLEDPYMEISVYKLLKKSPHPNIIGMHEIIETEASVGIVMEYGQSGDLLEFLQSQGPFRTEEDCRVMFSGILNGLHHLHRNLNICHLDVSLENIVLDDNLTPKLCDFGLAQKVTRSTSTMPEVKGPRPGKVKYMAPEIAEITPRKNKLDLFAADIYSLGVVLFCMVMGYHPYQCPDISDPDYHLVKLGHVQDIMEGVPVSDALVDLISRMMHYNPNERIKLSEIFNHPWMTSE